MVVGGTDEEWDAFDDAAWSTRVERLVAVAQAVGASWVTVHPIGRAACGMTGAVSAGDGRQADRRGTGSDVRIFHSDTGTSGTPGSSDDTAGHVTVIIDTEPDARTRFARALEMLAADGIAPDHITEDRLSPMLSHAPNDPDLAVILGPADRLPTSVSWELAYAEMVFLPDVSWDELDVEHLRGAVEQFQGRDRRFGGVDS